MLDIAKLEKLSQVANFSESTVMSCGKLASRMVRIASDLQNNPPQRKQKAALERLENTAIAIKQKALNSEAEMLSQELADFFNKF